MSDWQKLKKKSKKIGKKNKITDDDEDIFESFTRKDENDDDFRNDDWNNEEMDF